MEINIENNETKMCQIFWEKMIEIKGVNYFVPGRHILEDVTVDIPKGKITTIVGPNGCGKSTLIKMIAGFNKPHMGNIVVDGKDRSEYKPNEFARKVSFMMQFSSNISGVSVYDVVCYGREPYRKRFASLTQEDYDLVDWAIKVADISKFVDRDISNLSGGERQRVWLAMCLAQKPEVLVLDEPTNHLDMKYQYNLLELIKTLNEEHGITVLLVLHDINQAMRYSDNIIVMKQGKVHTSGCPNHCITKDVIHDVYEVETEIMKGKHTSVHVK